MVVAWRMTDPVFRAAIATNITLVVVNLVSSMRSMFVLVRLDTYGTLESLALTGTKFLIAVLPMIVLARRWRGWQRLHFAWLPLLYLLWPLVGTPAVPLLVGVSALSLWLIRFRGLRWTAILPLALICGSVPIHQFGAVWNHAALVERCARNDGRRPINLQPEQVAPRYKGASQLRPDEVLLPGSFDTPEPGGPAIGGSWWLRRTGNGWKIESPSKMIGTFWPGCVVDGELWLNRAPGVVFGVRRDALTGVESVRKITLPTEVMDVAEVACLPAEGIVLVTEALSGSGIWEIVTKTGSVRRLANEVGGIGTMVKPWRPGKIVAANGTDLLVYSLEREEVIDRTSAAVQMFGGVDVCPFDDEVAVCDVTGRCRFFKPDDQDHLRFEWGISVSSPRSLVYSPDCGHVVIASWDDESVWLVDRAARRVAATYRVGPALRGITFLGPREFAVADACTMTHVVF
jgi:hypothetical protein